MCIRDRFLFEDVMSDIAPRDGEDFSKPDSVNGSEPDDLSVDGHKDDNTTDKDPKGQGSSSSSDDDDSSSSNSSSSSSNSSSTSNNSGTSNNATTTNRSGTTTQQNQQSQQAVAN